MMIPVNALSVPSAMFESGANDPDTLLNGRFAIGLTFIIRCPKARDGSKEIGAENTCKNAKKAPRRAGKIYERLDLGWLPHVKNAGKLPALSVGDFGCVAVEFCQVNREFFVVGLGRIAEDA